ncbi:MAG: hypothetical protein ACOYD4_08240 [Solirubrobacterales bacterium]
MGRSPNKLSPAIVAWRAAHGLVALAFLASIAQVWWSALSRRRGRLLRAAVIALAAEGAVVAANHGDCPLGPLGERIGDPVPLFELVLPPRAARLAVPALGAIAGAGLLLLVARQPPADAAEVSTPWGRKAQPHQA